MNSPSNDTPELTAYALGELSADQAREVHAMLAALPSALSELEQVEAVTDALRQGAPIPQQRLTPGQRHAVLHPVNLPRFVVPMMPRQAPRRRPAQFWPAVRSFTKAAAVIAVAGLAFMAGRNLSIPGHSIAVAPVAPDHSDASAAVDPDRAATAAKTAMGVSEPSKTAVAETAKTVAPKAEPSPRPPLVVIAAPVPEPTPAVAIAKPAPRPQAMPKAPAATVAVAPAKPSAPAPGPAATRAVALSFTTPPASDAFVSASRRAADQFAIKPGLIRPLPARQDRSQQFASPATANAAAEPKPGKSRPAELYIHSWKAEVATCPWNEANRLLRIAIQLPADQAATAADDTYPIEVVFDANTVREYRMLCERHQPATELRSAGMHVIWYEFLPNGASEANRDNGKHVATVTLPGARFTIQAVAPFDGSKLRVLDRGQAWQAAHDDFVFESSVVGFGMLLRGAPQTGRLDHQLVLNLASKAKGSDSTAERGRFIRLVQEAQKAAGL